MIEDACALFVELLMRDAQAAWIEGSRQWVAEWPGDPFRNWYIHRSRAKALAGLRRLMIAKMRQGRPLCEPQRRGFL